MGAGFCPKIGASTLRGAVVFLLLAKINGSGEARHPTAATARLVREPAATYERGA